MTSLELRSKALPEGPLVLSLERVELDGPGPGEVIVRVEAAPINPTDLGMLLGPADPAHAKMQGDGKARRLIVSISADQAKALKPRMNLSLCPGLEGAGTVIAAGPGVEDLIGRTVAMFGGSMFAEFRRISIADCLILPEGTPPAKAAASFVNPQTALGVVETLRREGHKALVHTVGASNLELMLNRVCIRNGQPRGVSRSSNARTLSPSLHGKQVSAHSLGEGLIIYLWNHRSQCLVVNSL